MTSNQRKNVDTLICVIFILKKTSFKVSIINSELLICGRLIYKPRADFHPHFSTWVTSIEATYTFFLLLAWLPSSLTFKLHDLYIYFCLKPPLLLQISSDEWFSSVIFFPQNFRVNFGVWISKSNGQWQVDNNWN